MSSQRVPEASGEPSRERLIWSKYFLELIYARKVYFPLTEGLATRFALTNDMEVEVGCTSSVNVLTFPSLSSPSVTSMFVLDRAAP